MAQSLFEGCGGFQHVRRVVSDFYEKVLESEQLQGYFENIDRARLESLCNPMQILTNEDMAFKLGEGFLLEERGEEAVRGFGTQALYELKGERAGQT